MNAQQLASLQAMFAQHQQQAAKPLLEQKAGTLTLSSKTDNTRQSDFHINNNIIIIIHTPSYQIG